MPHLVPKKICSRQKNWFLKFWLSLILVIFNFGRLPFGPSSILVVFHFGHLPFWSSSILVIFHFGRLPFWSSSILVIFNFGHLPFWSYSILVVFHFGLSSIYFLQKSSSWVEIRWHAKNELSRYLGYRFILVRVIC